MDNENFLIVEQGAGKDNLYQNLIYKVSLKDATDISNLKLNDRTELEAGSFNELKDIQFISKKLVCNPREHGWQENKLEGLAVIDQATIAITNDNDFAIKGYKLTKAKCVTNKTYICEKVVPITDENKKQTNLWIIKFEDKLY